MPSLIDIGKHIVLRRKAVIIVTAIGYIILDKRTAKRDTPGSLVARRVCAIKRTRTLVIVRQQNSVRIAGNIKIDDDSFRVTIQIGYQSLFISRIISLDQIWAIIN